MAGKKDKSDTMMKRIDFWLLHGREEVHLIQMIDFSIGYMAAMIVMPEKEKWF